MNYSKARNPYQLWESYLSCQFLIAPLLEEAREGHALIPDHLNLLSSIQTKYTKIQNGTFLSPYFDLQEGVRTRIA
jgi:hypothetical protein